MLIWLSHRAVKSNNVAILFSNKAQPSTLLKAIALEFARRAKFFIVEKHDKVIPEEFRVYKYPTFVVLTRDGKQEMFRKKIDHGSLKSFLVETIGDPKMPPDNGYGKQTKDELWSR